MESFLGLLGGRGKRDVVADAQDIMYKAWDATAHQQRVALARKALAVSPLCADAYVLLAQESARPLDEALALYRQGMEAGERA
ncbi:MAG: hypothetical protein AAB223_05545, partial [Pseudomonadota bacterium]